MEQQKEEDIAFKNNANGFVDIGFSLKRDFPILIALAGVFLGISGMLDIFSISFQRTFPLSMLLVNFGFLFYNGRRTLFWKVLFFLMNIGWFVVTANL